MIMTMIMLTRSPTAEIIYQRVHYIKDQIKYQKLIFSANQKRELNYRQA